MAPPNPLTLIKRGTLFFWALYFFLVLASNLADGLIAAGVLPGGFAFASGNYGLIETVTSRYGVPAPVNAVLFIGVVLWEGLAAWLYVRAFLRYHTEVQARARDAYLAFGVGLALWAAFILMDELFIAYHIANLEGTHLNLLSAQFITLLALQLLPSEEPGVLEKEPSLTS